MFAVNSVQNQICLPATHFMSTLSSLRFSLRTSTSASRKDNEVQVEVDLSKDKMETSLDLLSNYPESEWRSFGLCPFCIKQNSRPKLSSHWRQSYISSSSFFENKHGMSGDLTQNPIHYYISLNKSAPKYNSSGIHWKGFKTIRSKSIEGLNSQTLKSEIESSFAQKFFNLNPWRGSKGKSKLGSEAEQHEKLKGLIAEGDLSPENQQKMKVAFAEGYIASDGRGKSESRLRFLPIVRDLMGIILILGLLFSLIGGTFRLQINNSNSVHPEDINVTFADVKGVEEAKLELQEIVEFLRNPEKFSALGGVLLVGPPGTGKTLLGRAVAGEAGVAFFHAAGPEFDEVLVGQGARRVRDLFSAAKARAPCVIFIDEIDSVGAKRTNSVLHPYANQTINQLLSEMDGFRQNEGVIVLGATNRREDLDKALLRPGRFDIEVHVPIPDLKGRTEILELYLGKIKLADDVDMDVLARGTTGFTGADIENLVNQAAIRAAVDQASAVSMKYLENARDKVLMGPERKSRIPDEEANKITAYHESGHAIVSFYTRDAHPLHKITIIPRGPSLGHTAYIPEKERYHVTKSQMLAMMDTMMGGRAAEELILGVDKITSGASSDLKEATALATKMVKEWGMSEKVGVRTFEADSSPLVVVNELGQSTSEVIDAEIKRLLMESYERAKSILKNHAKEHLVLAEALIKYETLDAEDIKGLLGVKGKYDKE